MEIATQLSFGDFPEDVQLCVLSFLRPCDLAAFASTCKRFVSLYRNDQRLWFSMCHRRWGSKTLINKWGSGKISYKRLYRILDEYDNLIGFWRRCGDASAAAASSPPLVFFEWGPFYITGSRISPSLDKGYEVIKKTFLWMSIASKGQPVNYLDPDGRFALREEDLNGEPSGIAENDLIQVNVNFIGESHVVVEENFGFSGFTRALSSGNMKPADEYENVYGSPPDKLMTEIYQYFANRTSPSGNGASRRQRRREKEKQGRMRKWEAEHFVKIVNCSPKPVRPLQGLWKGICEDMSLDFYLVSYDDVGGIDCRKIGDSSIPIFWTSSSTFIDSPFSPEENHIYNCRLHITPINEADQTDEDNLSSSSLDNNNGVVSRMLYINSCYDLVIPDSAGTTANPRHVEGRIWQYGNGTFGFGFLRDNYIIDLKHIAANGHILDTLQQTNG